MLRVQHTLLCLLGLVVLCLSNSLWLHQSLQSLLTHRSTLRWLAAALSLRSAVVKVRRALYECCATLNINPIQWTIRGFVGVHPDSKHTILAASVNTFRAQVAEFYAAWLMIKRSTEHGEP